MQTPARLQIAPGTKVLVTGATGFIGWHLCRRLLALDIEVHATSRHDRPGRAGEPIWWQADMADLANASRVFSAAKPEVVVHLSGMTGARIDRDLVLSTYHSLATSTINVLVLASERGCTRVVLFGSLNEPVPSLEPPIPGSPYAAAKWIGSAYGRMFHALYGTPVVNLRPFMTYGPAQAHEKLIPTVVLSLLRGQSPRLSSGQMRGDWIYVDDVVAAAVIALTTPGIEGQTFDLGTGRLTSQRALVDELLAVMGSHIAPQFGAIPDRPREQEIVADTVPALKCLGWQATTTLPEGLRKTADWYKVNPDPSRLGDLDGPTSKASDGTR